jgi:hypothetical protein
MDDQIIAECKQFIEKGDTEAFQIRVKEMLDTEYPREPDYPYIFHRVYLHACLKGRGEMASWLHTVVYPQMDPIQQIGLRQIFPYGRTLIQKAASKNSLNR